MTEIPYRRIAFILASLGAIAPLSIDMYLPGMPQMVTSLQTSEGAMQFSLMTFFGGLMIGQLFYGPLSDRFGRKPLIYMAMTVFAIGSFGAAAAKSADALIVWRFVEGLGGSIGSVISLAIVRDLYSGRAAATLIAMIMIVQGAAPIIAPLIGNAIIAAASWHAIFIILGVYGFSCLAIVGLYLPETRLSEARQKTNLRDVATTYVRLIGRRNYIPYIGVFSLCMAGFFSYLAGSSFVFISLYGLPSSTYSLLFAFNALGLAVGAQTAPRLMGRFHPQTIVRGALTVYATTAIALAVVEFTEGNGPVSMAAMLFVIITANSFVMPLSSVMAMEAYGAIAGVAAALMGASNFGAGLLASLAVGLLSNGSARPMVVILAVCGAVAWLVAFLAFPKRHSSAETAPASE